MQANGGKRPLKNLLRIKRFAILLIVPFVFTACAGPSGPSGPLPTENEPATIKIWRTFDSDESFSRIIEIFEERNPTTKIDYRKLPLEEYELRVSEALAAGNGPDIWSIRNDWMPRHRDKLVPMPEGLLGGKEQRDLDYIKDKFVPIVNNDVVFDGRIYGLPFYVDTLSVFINEKVYSARKKEYEDARRFDDARFLDRKEFNTWDSFQKAVQLLTKKDDQANISFSGLAAGTSNNVNIASDVVSLMMLQNGTQMIAPNQTNASFHLTQKNAVGQDFFPGTEALTRYTSFADKNSPHYSWNDSMPSDIQAFLDGKVAMIFGYQYYTLIFDQIAPTLKYDTIPLPQVRDTAMPVDYANYWVETVTKNADNPAIAWSVLKSLVIDQGSGYRSATKRPSPITISSQVETINRHKESDPFKFQTQTANGWFKTKRPDKADKIFSEMIQKTATGKLPAQTAIGEAAQSVSNILQQQDL